MTEWRRVPISPYRSYEVSDDGRVRRGSREMVGYVDRYGYRTVLLSYAGLAKRFKVHRLVCEAFHGPCANGREVGHLSGDKTDNSANNLAWVTRSENQAHQQLHGKNGGIANLVPGQPRGENNPTAKLTEKQADEIRTRVGAGETCRPLAREYGVSKDAINRIARRLTYSEAETPNG